MRSIIVSLPSIGGNLKVRYPDESVFAFNPLYMELETGNMALSYVELVAVPFAGSQLPEKAIRCTLYQGKAKIYYSRLLQLFFTDIIHQRTVFLKVQLRHNGITIFSTMHKVLWGSLHVGEKFPSGVFKWEKGRTTLEITRIWFKNYPFTVSLFSDEQEGIMPNISGLCDGADVAQVYYPSFIGIRADLAEIATSTVNDAVTPTAIYFVSDTLSFHAVDSAGNASTQWSSTSRYQSSEMYNDVTTARNDMFWVSEEEPENLYRFDSQEESLCIVDYSNPYPHGIFELRPSLAFPDAEHIAIYRQQQPGDGALSTFDFTFDYTFFMSHSYDVRVRLLVCDYKAGYYLRWIDQFGNFQYFLFTKGTEEIKNTLSDEAVYEDLEVRGMSFPERKRVSAITSTRTFKCCATGLTEEIYDYVSSVLHSSVIDLYLGTSEGGFEIWVPINIAAGTYKKKVKDVLHDLEIGFTMSDIQAQTL